VNRRRAIEWFGWYGSVAIITAYALLSFKVVSATSAPYQLLNLSGAAGIISIALVDHDKQVVVLNVFWFIIALAALVRMISSW
jgi:hypothetical protein